MNITGPVSVVLLANDGSAPTSFLAVGNAPYTLFTVGPGVTVPTDEISLYNTHPFIEVTGGGVYQSGQNICVTLAPTSTIGDSISESSTVDHVSFTLQQVDVGGMDIGGGSGEGSFAPSAYSLSRMRGQLTAAMRANPKNPFEALMSALSESDNSEPRIIKFKGNYRLWAAPYSVNIRNTGSAGPGSGFQEKDYGMLLGGSHYFKSVETNMSAVVAIGLIKQQKDAKASDKTNGKQLVFGVTAGRSLFKKYEHITSLYVAGADKTEYRSGQQADITAPNFLARSDYRTSMVSLQTELGRVFKLEDNYSLRPCLGIQAGISRRSAFTEKNTGTKAPQHYGIQVSRAGEVYTGLGFRKKWSGDKYEGKITVIYQVGQKSGNGKSSTVVTAGSQSMSSTSPTPGRLTQYLNIYGSLLDKESHWKIIPSMSFVTQKGQRSITSSIKIEYRF